MSDGSLRWVPNPSMGNFHLMCGGKSVGHFYPDNEAGADITALLARIVDARSVTIIRDLHDMSANPTWYDAEQHEAVRKDAIAWLAENAA